MKPKSIARWSIPACLVVAGSSYAASPTLDGIRDGLYGASASSQDASVIEIFSDPFALELQTDNNNVGGVGALAATNFKGEPADVLTGIELSIGLGELGWDTVSPINVCIFVNNGGTNFLNNQVSGGLNPASPEGQGANIGNTPFNFDDVGGPLYAVGQQYLTVTNVQAGSTITLDGVVDTVNETEYGAPVYINGPIGSGTENPTGFADNNDPDTVTANGSEIDAIRMFRDSTTDTLYIHVSGNLETNFNKLGFFFDVKAGGENIISGTPPFAFNGLQNMTGSQFDTTPALFEFDYYLHYGGNTTDHFLDVAEITTDTVNFAGGDRVSNPTIILNPGLNGGAIELATDNSNILGITGPGGGDGIDTPYPDPLTEPSDVTTGVEFSFDLDAIDWNGTDPVNIVAFLTETDQVQNQVAGGLPNDTGILGPGDGVDFPSIAGNQFVSIATLGSTTPTIDGVLDGAGTYTELWVNEAGGTGNSTTLDDNRAVIADGLGACCFGTRCTLLTSADCTTAGGTFTAVGTDCSGNPNACGGVGADIDPVGSEIDGVYATIINDVGGNTLYGFVSGNFGQFKELCVFLDSKPGGQNPLRTDNPDVKGNYFNNLGGMIFDTGVEPDFGIVYNLGTNDPDGTPNNGDEVVEHFVDGVQLLTLGGEDPDGPPAGGAFDSGVKSSTNLMGDLIARTGFGNNSLPDVLLANGSELNNVTAFVDDFFLWIHIGGDLETNFTKLEVFMDIIDFDIPSQTGGQNTLIYDADPPLDDLGDPNPNYEGNCDLDFQALNRMGGPFEVEPGVFQPGFTFDLPFFADHFVYATNGGDDPLFPGEPEWFGGIQRLRNSLREDPANPGQVDPGECIFWGGTSFSDFGDFVDTPGEFAGLYLDQSNILGVTGGANQFQPDDSPPAGVTEGIEFRIPLSEIIVPQSINDPGAGDPLVAEVWQGQSTFRLCIFINGGFHSFVSNQFLQPICDQELGEPRLVDLEADHPGNQYLELVPGGTMTAYTNISPAPAPCVGGGCCFSDGSCLDLTAAQCSTAGGTYQGDDMFCASVTCPVEGACCVGAVCLIAQGLDDCVNNFSGVYQGDGTDCTVNPCVVTGACCWACPDGATCVDNQTRDDCRDILQGQYAGDSTSCGAICDTQCKGDLDGNGTNDVFDFGIFATSFGTLVGAGRCDGDLDCNGNVNVFDFGIYAADFGCLTGAVPGSCAP